MSSAAFERPKPAGLAAGLDATGWRDGKRYLWLLGLLVP